MNNNEITWNYVFHFNEYTKKWYAIHRDKYLEYWSLNRSIVNDTFLNDESLEELIKKIKE